MKRGQYTGEKALDIPGLAAVLGVLEWKAREHASGSTFPTFRVGSHLRFWPSEVEEWKLQQLAPKDPWKQSARSLGRKRVGR